MKQIFLLIFGLVAFFHVAKAQTLRTIEVEGNSEMMIIPDEALIHITVQKKAMSVSGATKALNAASKKIADEFKESDLTSYELTANNYFVNVNRVFHKGTSKDSGYVASQNLKIKIQDIEKELAKAVEMINVTGDQSLNVSFEVSREMEKNYKDQMLEAALQDAQTKAKRISEIMSLKNTTVQKIKYLSEQGFTPTYQMKTSAMRFDSAESREEPIFMPEEQKISDRILVTFIFDN